VAYATSFEHVKDWVRDIDQHAGSNPIKVLVGNMCELTAADRQVSFEQGKVRLFVFKFVCTYLLTSICICFDIFVDVGSGGFARHRVHGDVC
jgi:hypothetical protein